MLKPSNKSSTTSSDPSDKDTLRAYFNNILSLRLAAQEAVLGERSLFDRDSFAKCGWSIGNSVGFVYNKDSDYASTQNVQTCKSAWSCPVCSRRISEIRRKEVNKAIEAHETNDGEVFLVTLTFPHGREDDLADLASKLKHTSKRFKENHWYSKIRKDFNLVGTIRAAELNYSDVNGWHPHLHELWFVDRGKSQMGLKKDVYKIWKHACEMSGLGTPNFRNGVDVKTNDKSKSGLGDYVTKWGLDSEITKGNSKISKNKKGSSPFQLVADYRDGDKRAGMLFRDYHYAMKGKRQLVWSPGLKKKFGVTEVSDKNSLKGEEPFLTITSAENFYLNARNDMVDFRAYCAENRNDDDKMRAELDRLVYGIKPKSIR